MEKKNKKYVQKKVKVVRKTPKKTVYYRRMKVLADEEPKKKNSIKGAFNIDDIKKEIESKIDNEVKYIKKHLPPEKLKSLIDKYGDNYELLKNLDFGSEEEKEALKKFIKYFSGADDNFSENHTIIITNKDKNEFTVTHSHPEQNFARSIKFKDDGKVIVDNEYFRTSKPGSNTAERMLLTQALFLDKYFGEGNQRIDILASTSLENGLIGAGIQAYKGAKPDNIDINYIRNKLPDILDRIANIDKNKTEKLKDMDPMEFLKDGEIELDDFEKMSIINYIQDEMRTMDSDNPKVNKVLEYLMLKIGKESKVRVRDLLKFIESAYNARIESTKELIDNWKYFNE